MPWGAIYRRVTTPPRRRRKGEPPVAQQSKYPQPRARRR